MLVSLGRRVALIPFGWALFIFTAAIVIKSGVHPIGPLWIQIVRDATNGFPNAVNYMSTSPLPILLYELIGGRNLIWWALHSILISLFVLVALTTIVRRYNKTKHLASILFLSSPIFLVLLYFVGHYDLFTIAGAAIAVFSKRNSIRFLGVLIASLANPDQALVTAVILLMLALVIKEKDLRSLGAIYLGTSVSVFVGVRLIVQNVGGSARSSVILNELEPVIKSSFGVWTLVPLSVVGIVGIFIALNLKQTSRRYWLSLCIALGIPSILSLLILDKTRVGVAVSATAVLYLVKGILDRLENEMSENQNSYFENLGLVTILALFYPALYFDIGGELRLPYKELLTVIVG